MSRMSISRLLGFVAAFMIVVGLPAYAAAADADVAGGYSFQRITNEPGTNIPGGWFASVGGNVTPMFGVVFDVSGAYKTESESFSGVTVSSKSRMHSFMAGPRVMSQQGLVTVFGQVLFGGVHLSTEMSGSGAGVTVSGSETETDFAIQPGGGVDVKVSGKVGVRVGVNYRAIRPKDSGEWGKVVQVVAGVVCHVGKP